MPKCKDKTLVINNALRMIMKSMVKLQEAGVLVNCTYCLAKTGTVFTTGWENICQLVRSNINEKESSYTKMIKDSFEKLSTTEGMPPVQPILPVMPPPKDCNRDELRNFLTDMIRISQSKGNSAIHICTQLMHIEVSVLGLCLCKFM